MENSSVFLAALNDLLGDDSFSTGSMEAFTALEAAKGLKRWCEVEDNRESLDAFSNYLVGDLRAICGPVEGPTLNREKMWKAFFSLRSSTTFISRWVAFLQEAGAVPMPILYQSLTDILLRLLIHRQYNIATTTEPTTSLSSNEGNTLRYAAGYIV